MYKKHVFIIFLFTILITSCRSKKNVSCPTFDIEKPSEKLNKKGSKYEVVILKDGNRINKKKKRKKPKNRLFKKKIY